MAAITDDQVYDLIAGECGKPSDAAFRTVIALLWTEFYGKLYADDFWLRYLATRWHSASYLLGELRLNYDQEEDDIKESLRQQYEQTERLALQFERKLEKEKALSGGDLLFAVGQMTKTSPIPYADYQGVNPNSLILSGSPVLSSED